MIDIFFKTLPFFALIALGYGAARTRFFGPEATSAITRFVFYFALSAMLFRFSANLTMSEVFDPQFIMAYLLASVVIYVLAIIVAFARKQPVDVAAVEAQCAVTGNTGFLGIPMLALLMGAQAIGPTMMVLAVDLIVFSSLIVILITGSRDGRMRIGVLKTVAMGLLKNPMIVSIALGLAWSAYEMPMPQPLNEFVSILGAAATPGALFAIGASLADKSAERLEVAAWLTFCKLVLHPAAVAFAALVVFDVEPFAASVMIAASSLPVAGNVYMLAQHYKAAPQRVSASILISTTVSILTVSAVIAWVAVVPA
ncbi:MAG: AEC family transporter [Pseudomonadota bacterium]|nr:AEC family transporter [Pseudomonadota bacterium]MEE3069501.1 AEC family transporter [Pseudomonadota bacterium]